MCLDVLAVRYDLRIVEVTALTKKGKKGKSAPVLADADAVPLPSQLAAGSAPSPTLAEAPVLAAAPALAFDDEEPTGDGRHSPDAKNLAADTLRLRAERKGDGDGRVYLIVVTATDESGNTAFSCTTVVVPKSLKKGDTTVNDQAAAARAVCEANDGAPPPGFFVCGDGLVIGPHQCS